MSKIQSTNTKQGNDKKTKNHFLSFFYSRQAVYVCWFVLFLAIFSILFVHGISYLDPDFGWHLRVGQDIISTEDVPRTEKYTFPTEGESWVDHEWLSNILLFRIHQSSIYGFWTLSALFALITISTFILVAYLTKKIVLPKTNPWKFFFFSSLFVFAGTYSLLSAFGIRLQVLTWLFTLLLVAFFVLISHQKKRWPLFAAPLMMILWANMHGTFVTGLLCFGAYVFFVFLVKKISLQDKFFVLASFAVSVASTLLTPYSFQLWRLVFEEYTQNRGYLQQIKEWLPMYAAPYIEWYSALYISLFLAILIIGLLSKVIQKKLAVVVYLVFVVGLLLLSVQSRRFLPLFTFTSFPISIYVLIKIFPALKIKKSYVYFLTIFFFSFVVAKIDYARTVPLNLFEQNIESSPYHAVLFLKDHPELNELNLYNQYGWGGYLDWMWPEKKLFIDGRMPQRPLEGGETYIDEYLAFRQADTMIKQLKKYDIKLVLIPPFKPYKQAEGLEKHLIEDFFMVDLKKFNKEEPLYGYLQEHWQEIYADDVAIVFLHPDIEFK